MVSQLEAKNQIRKEVERLLQVTDYTLQAVGFEVIHHLVKNENQELLPEQNKPERNLKNKVRWFEQTLTLHLLAQTDLVQEKEKKQRSPQSHERDQQRGLKAKMI